VITMPRVLVVDGLAETETVLRAVLEPQGAAVERRRGITGMVAGTRAPQVLIVDRDDPTSGGLEESAWPGVPRVVLGSVRVAADHGERFLEKPFHYPELIQMVQSLLDLPTECRRVG